MVHETIDSRLASYIRGFMIKGWTSKAILVAIIGLLIFSYYWLDLGQHLSIANLKEHKDSLHQFYIENQHRIWWNNACPLGAIAKI